MCSYDGHTAFSYGLASALCDLHPEADRDVVLPATILHDTGWSRVPEARFSKPSHTVAA